MLLASMTGYCVALTSRLPCYVFCICLLTIFILLFITNKYQKYKSVELGDQLSRSLDDPCIRPLSPIFIHYHPLSPTQRVILQEELRALSELEEERKTEDDRKREDLLLEELVECVKKRNELVN